MSVFCGQCDQEFETPELELEHICPATGVAPTDPRTMGPNWQAIQEAALARGEAEQQE